MAGYFSVKTAMLKEPTPRQHTLEMVILEDLVPADHLLRKIDKYIDFEFIRNQVRHLYCDNNGRPAVDPVLLFKMLFIGYLFGVRSERQLVREVQVNVAYRWFLGLSLTDKIIDASTFSQQRRRRFFGNRYRAANFRWDCASSHSAWFGRWRCALHRQHPHESQCQQKEI